jgi:hypothetical protein
LGIHGLMPPRFKTQEEQLELCKTSVERYQEDLNKYLYLVELQVIVTRLCVLRYGMCVLYYQSRQTPHRKSLSSVIS